MAIKLGTAKISNSYRGLRFKVTTNDIEQGQPNNPCACAAARALKRQTGARLVAVYRDVTYIQRDKDKADRFRTPPSLRIETIVFDRKGVFHPGEYELQAMPIGPASKTTSSSSKKSASAPRHRNKRPPPYKIPDVRPTASQKLDV